MRSMQLRSWLAFYYQNLRRHPEWNYVEATFNSFNFADELSKDLASGLDMEGAVKATAGRLKAAFETTLSRAPMNTLNWWVREFEPWKYVKMEIDTNIPVSSYDASEV